MKRVASSFRGRRPNIGYGMTETNAYGPGNTGDDYVAQPTSTGRAVPILELRVRDPDGNVLPSASVGEIWFNGPNLIRGYWNKPEATAETIVDGWLRSGDIGRIDDEGFVYVEDRAKDMVLRAGENVYCAEVEAAIYEHPAVLRGRGVRRAPRAARRGGGRRHLRAARPRSDPDELRTFVGERLAAFKVPTVVSIVHEPLPRNPAGKILKRELRDSLSA